jgi:hypothetical protein
MSCVVNVMYWSVNIMSRCVDILYWRVMSCGVNVISWSVNVMSGGVYVIS